MAGILVSYRQRDSGGWAGRIYDRLGARFGRDHLHYDLGDTASDISAAVAVIGPEWLSARHPESDTTVADTGDEVATELATLLQVGVPVIPVLVDGAALPAAGSLPTALQPLAAATPLVVRSVSFEDDVAALIARLEHTTEGGAAAPSAAPGPSRQPVIAIAAAAALAILGLVVALLLAGSAETGSAPVEYLLRA